MVSWEGVLGRGMGGNDSGRRRGFLEVSAADGSAGSCCSSKIDRMAFANFLGLMLEGGLGDMFVRWCRWVTYG